MDCVKLTLLGTQRTADTANLAGCLDSRSTIVGAALYQMLCRQIPSFIMIRFYNRFFIYILQSPVYKNNRNRTGLQYFSCIHTVGHDNDSICFHLYQHLNILHLFFCIIP